MEAKTGAVKAAGTVAVQAAAQGFLLRQIYGAGRQLPAPSRTQNDSTFRPETRIKNDSIFTLLCRNTDNHDSCPGNGKSIPLGINQHWIVIAQSVRKGAPLNPDIYPLEPY